MARILITLVIAALISGCANRACELCGRWRSNAELTLAEMEKTPDLSEKKRQFFRDGFYGRLVIETKAHELRTYFQDQSSTSAAWEPWQIVSRSGDTFTTKYFFEGEPMVHVITLNGSCYKVLQPSLGFAEWFCKEP
jgi:hypothetical protein